MKLIEALKKVKDLLRKADDIKEKISKHCSDLDCETPVYENQKAVVSAWIQAHSDLLKEVEMLQFRIMKTNISTKMCVEIDGNFIEKSIFEWMSRRKTLAEKELSCWKCLGDRGLREGAVNQSSGSVLMVKIRRYFDPEKRDQKIFVFSSEPSIIDGKLEIANCVTDLLD